MKTSEADPLSALRSPLACSSWAARKSKRRRFSSALSSPSLNYSPRAPPGHTRQQRPSLCTTYRLLPTSIQVSFSLLALLCQKRANRTRREQVSCRMVAAGETGVFRYTGNTFAQLLRTYSSSQTLALERQCSLTLLALLRAFQPPTGSNSTPNYTALRLPSFTHFTTYSKRWHPEQRSLAPRPSPLLPPSPALTCRRGCRWSR